MKGRKKPDKHLRLVGNTRNRLQPSTVKALKTLPECPDYLEGEARELWTNLGGELVKRGVLTALDFDSFAALCICYGNTVQAQRILQKEGIVIADKKGSTKKNPAYSMWSGYMNLYRMFCNDFGLSPVSRNRVPIPYPDDDDGGDL